MEDPVAPIGPSIALEVYLAWGLIALAVGAAIAGGIFLVRRRRSR
jgi:hypothetical protein